MDYFFFLLKLLQHGKKIPFSSSVFTMERYNSDQRKVTIKQNIVAEMKVTQHVPELQCWVYLSVGKIIKCNLKNFWQFKWIKSPSSDDKFQSPFATPPQTCLLQLGESWFPDDFKWNFINIKSITEFHLSKIKQNKKKSCNRHINTNS